MEKHCRFLLGKNAVIEKNFVRSTDLEERPNLSEKGVNYRVLCIVKFFFHKKAGTLLFHITIFVNTCPSTDKCGELSTGHVRRMARGMGACEGINFGSDLSVVSLAILNMSHFDYLF